jgi:uncharacterized protein YcfJ
MNRSVLAATLLAATAAGAQADSFVDQARVRDVQPQYETVQVPREVCGSQWVQPAPVVTAPSHNYGGAVIGGVAGGILGNQVGGGSGRDAATAVGAVVGAVVGDRIANRDRGPATVYESAPREVRSCQTVMERESRLTGYRVTYEYRGHPYTTFTREQPGPTLPVRVSVTPVEAEYHRRH